MIAGASDGTIALAGDVDVANAQAVLQALLDLPVHGPVTLDLSDVSFIDSSGLRTLLHFSSHIGTQGGVLTTVAPPAIVRLFELTGLVEILNTTPG